MPPSFADIMAPPAHLPMAPAFPQTLFRKRSSLDDVIASMPAVSQPTFTEPDEPSFQHALPNIHSANHDYDSQRRHACLFEGWHHVSDAGASFRTFTEPQQRLPGAMVAHHGATVDQAASAENKPAKCSTAVPQDALSVEHEPLDSSARMGKQRSWTNEDKEKHSNACRSKTRLTLSEKLEIIRLYESRDLGERKSQKELAIIFDKSRMTISTLLRPDSIAWYKQLADGGIRGEAKRCKRSGYPDLERTIFKAIGKGKVSTTKADILNVAESIACKEGVPKFKPTNNWVSRFIQQHNIPITKQPQQLPQPLYTRSTTTNNKTHQHFQVQHSGVHSTGVQTIVQAVIP